MGEPVTQARYHQHPADLRSGQRHVECRTESASDALVPGRHACGQHSGSSGWIHRFHHHEFDGDQCRQRRLRKSDSDSDANGHTYTDCHTNGHGNRHAYTDTNRNGDGHGNSNSDCASSVANPYRHTQAYADAQAAADASPAGALIGKPLRWSSREKPREFPSGGHAV